MKLHIVFDTSILRDSTHQLLNSSEIMAITELAENDKIQIYIPYIVEQEFKTQRINGYINRIKKIPAAMQELNSDQKKNNKEWYNKIDEFKNILNSNIRNIALEKISYIDEWITRSKAQRVNIEPKDAENVFEKYFAGKKPFSKIKETETTQKNRKDIPDAFIFEAILNIAKNNNSIIAIVNDAALGDACTDANIKNFSTLDEFVKSEEYKETQKDNYISKNSASIINQLRKHLSEKRDYNIENILKNYLSKENGIVEISEKLDKDVDAIDIKDIQVNEKIYYIGGDIFSGFFNAKSYIVFLKKVKSDNNNAELYIKQTDILNFSGRINILIDVDSIKDNCNIELDQINIKKVFLSDIQVDSLESERKNIDVLEDDCNLHSDGVSHYVLNTNINNSQEDHNNMLKEGIASAFYDPWKYNINKLKYNDIVFLYQSGSGIVAYGKATGDVIMRDHNKNKLEEHYMKLNDFCIMSSTISASEMKIIAGKNFNFRKTMYRLDNKSGELILNVCMNNCQNSITNHSTTDAVTARDS